MVEEYDLTPHKKLEKLEKEVEHIKKYPIGSSSTGKNLLNAIESLNENINKLIDVFNEAAARMSQEGEEIEESSEAHNKIDMLADQNKEIAEAVVSLADEMKKHREVPAAPKPEPIAKPAGPLRPGPPMMPSTGVPAGLPPLNASIPPMPDFGPDLNAPPELESAPKPEKKKGGFFSFKKH